MRKVLSFCAVLLLAGTALLGQGGLTLYNMPYIPQSSYLNPANTPHNNFYISLPALSGVGVGFNNDFFALGDLKVDLFARWEKSYGDSLLASFADAAQISNRLGLRGEVDLFGFGLRSGKHYISFYIREVLQADLSFPDEFFRFVNDYGRDLVFQNTNNKTGYIMSGGRMNVTQYRPFTLQYAYDISPAFTLGGKVSYISGIYTLDATMDTLFTQIKEEDKTDWEMVGRINARTGGYSNADSSNFGNIFINPQNSGFSFGLGGRLTTLDDRLDISFSAVNFGRIFWNQKVGLTTFTDESFENAEGLGEVFDTLFRVEERANVEFTQALNPEFFLNANYYLSRSLSIGALLRAQSVFSTLNSSFGLFFNARPAKWFGFTTGYIYSNRAHNIPLGITLNPGPFQLYAITDNALGFASGGSARQAHVNVGLNLVFGKTMRAWTEKEPAQDDMDTYPDVYLPEEEEEIPAEVEGDPFMPPPAGEDRDTIISPTPEPLNQEDEVDITSYLVTNPIFLHRGPNSGTTVLDTIAPNTVVTVLQKSIPDWWYVEYDNKSGWIQPRSIRPSMEMPVAEQEEDEIPATPVATFIPQDYIMLDNTPMREAASETARELHILKKWDEVLVLEKTNSVWWKIRHEGSDGYVKSAMLNPRPENYVRPEEEAVAPAPAPPKAKPQTSLGVFTLTESTSLRAEPTHKSNALMRLRQGMEVRVLEKTTDLWWKVEARGMTGYCKAANLTSQ
ncbi:MAG: DUF5723 family protein [Saprospiraceae bacterium]